MRLICIASGSDGNSYVLQAENGEKLILDAGVKLEDIKKAMKFNVSNISGCCISHLHNDHTLSKQKLENMGVPVFAPYENPKVLFRQLGNFRVKAFELTDSEGNPTHTNGDGSPCTVFGFYITHPEMGSMLYITDTNCVKYRFTNQRVNHILVSANYDSDMADFIQKGKGYHVLSGHFSIQNVCEFLKVNATEDLRTVVLCHLSAENTEPQKCIEMAKSVVRENVTVEIARKNLVIERI